MIVCVGVYGIVAQMEEIEMETLKLNDVRWLDKEEVPKCKQCGQTLPYPTCAKCKHSRVLRTSKQTLRKTWICSLQYEAITCEISEEDIDKPVKCPFFEETQFEECK